MVDSSKLALFLTAALLLAVAPGPGMLYVLARSLAGGRREGVLSALGTFVGGMVHVLAAAAGVSVVLARSAVAFATIKYAGAAYLCFLGVRMILAASRDRDKDELPTAALPPTRNPFWQGIATEVLNPKTALFFLSFIPQFVNREAGHVFAQFLALGAVSVTLNTSRAAHSHGRNHDWLGNLLGREQVGIAPYRQRKKQDFDGPQTGFRWRFERARLPAAP
jgi:threonine/homoserine/homoserine lactone efflux protein